MTHRTEKDAAQMQRSGTVTHFISSCPPKPRRWGISAFLITLVAAGAANSNPYTGIVDRNVFSLKPPTVVDPTPVTPPSPPVKLTLTGITTILGNKRALLKAQTPAKAPAPAKDESYMLTEGQSADGIQVVSIDERSGKVIVNNNGLTETLDFMNHGAKLLAAAPAPVTPGVIPAPGMPGAAPGTPGSMPMPPRTMRTQQQGASGQPGDTSSGEAGLSGRGQRGTTIVQQLEPEVQTVMMEVERERTRDAVSLGLMPPLPPTVITPEDSPDFIPSPEDSPDIPPLAF